MHGKVLDSASHKNKLLLWNVFVKWLLDGWGCVSPVAGRRVSMHSSPARVYGQGRNNYSVQNAQFPSLNFHFLLHFVSVTTLVSKTKELAPLFMFHYLELSCV